MDFSQSYELSLEDLDNLKYELKKSFTINPFLAEIFLGFFARSIFPFALFSVQHDTVSAFAVVILRAAVPVCKHGQTGITPRPRPVAGFVPISQPWFNVCKVFKESLFVSIRHAKEFATKIFTGAVSIVPSLAFKHFFVAKWAKVTERAFPTSTALKIWKDKSLSDPLVF